jgi:hypothetical protein
MTLIEVSLVIALLIGLIYFSFVGLADYRRGADKARCKMQLAAVQKVVRSQANFYNLAVGAMFATSNAFGAGMAMEKPPVCPAGGAYAWSGIIPAIDAAYGSCDFIDTDAVTTHILTVLDTRAW